MFANEDTSLRSSCVCACQRLRADRVARGSATCAVASSFGFWRACRIPDAELPEPAAQGHGSGIATRKKTNLEIL